MDPEGFGKIKAAKLLVRTVKGGWKVISRVHAERLLDKKGARILVEGPAPSKRARHLAKQKWGSKKKRHDAHRPGERPHWQHQSGNRGKLMYSLGTLGTLGVCTLGDNPLGHLVDFLNPLADISDLFELGTGLLDWLGEGSEEAR